MPLGLRFLHTSKKSKKNIQGESNNTVVGKTQGIELKSLSDPLLNVSSAKIQSINIITTGEKSESVQLLPDINSSAPCCMDQPIRDQETIEDKDEINPVEIPAMTNSYFDRNGNPVDEEDEIQAEPEPKCFINAAALLDEEGGVYVPSPPPSILTTVGTNQHTQNQESIQQQPSGIPVSIHRRRVPISKSFPDIVQTTMKDNTPEPVFRVFKPKLANHKTPPENLLDDSIIVADSLEEIPRVGDVLDGASSSSFSATSVDPHMETAQKMFERLMSESVMGGHGIINEKPPETWVVDFNSYNLENDEIVRQRRKSTSSNNSLAYFISMDDVSENESLTRREELTASTDSKKIFSMFVDIGKESSGGGTPGSPKLKHVDARGKSNNGDNSSNLRLKALHSGIPKIMGKRSGSGSMSSSLAMSTVSDPDVGQFGVSSNRSSLHVANHEHDGSFSSSILSSMEMSACALEEMDVCQGGPCFKLGMDLLRMFQEGINTDVNISVRGRYVKAHKCILASRSQYFAAVLSGNWIQKAGNTIHLDEFSYSTVQFTMYHIYSGTNEIPDSIDLMELASLTDMLGLEGLREVISQTIRNRFCHNFHRPCTGCITGILEFFPLAVNYGMDELHRKMTKWICKHFVRIWPTKAFANLGDELIEKCLRFSVNHLSPENLLDVTLGCDQLLSTMPTVRWTEPIFSIVNQLSVACVQFVGEHFSEVLQSQRFLLFGKGQTWNISRIENTVLEGILLLKPDEACLSHIALCRLIDLGTKALDEVEWSMMFVDFLKNLRKEVESYLLANASKAVLSRNWESLSQEVRKRICSTSFLGSDKSGSGVGGAKAKIQVKSAGHPTSTSPAFKNARSVARAQSRANSGGQQRIATPQQEKMKDETPSPNPVEIEVKRTHTPLPLVESSQKATSTKSVASVKPMQSQPQTPTVISKTTPNVYSSGSRNTGTFTRNTKSSTPKATTPIVTQVPTATNSVRRKPYVEKERSFDTLSRVSSAGSSVQSQVRRGSASRGGSKPVTPSTPSTKPPFNTFTTKHPIRKKPIEEPSPPPPPPAKVFLTNSEKAKAVSKPKLVFRSSRSNSVSNEAEFGIIKSNSPVGSSTAAGGQPRTPNLSQAPRYTKPKTNSEKTIKPSGSPLAKPRNNRTTVPPPPPQTQVVKNTGANVRSGGTFRVNRSNLSGSGRTTKTVDKKKCNNESNMSKSSIEMDSDGSEPKVRTLAEIGRSSTFSKDEPTVLGKLDISLDYST